MTDLATQLNRSPQDARRTQFTALVTQQGPRLAEILPRGMDLERFTALGKVELSRNPDLLDCDPLSFLAALTTCATLALEPGPLGLAFIIPFKKKATVVLGYKGIVALAYRSSLVKEIRAWPVYEGDEWSGLRATETGDHFTHVPAPPRDRGAVSLFVGRARLRTGGNIVHVMYPEEIEARAKRSAAYTNPKGPWATDRLAMACKTVILAMQPSLPMVAAFGDAMRFDEQPARWDDGPELDAGAFPEDTSATEGSGE